MAGWFIEAVKAAADEKGIIFGGEICEEFQIGPGIGCSFGAGAGHDEVFGEDDQVRFLFGGGLGDQGTESVKIILQTASGESGLYRADIQVIVFQVKVPGNYTDSRKELPIMQTQQNGLII